MIGNIGSYCGARTHACRVETLLDTFLLGSKSVGTSANAARVSACATSNSNVICQKAFL